MEYGHFDDASRTYVVTNLLTPKPWINYLGNGRLQAFISQNAGGLMWYLEPESRRLTRYHYLAGPADRPGFYLYVKDHRSGSIWNPHFAPAGVALDHYECRHSPGVTTFVGRKDGVQVSVDYLIPLEDNVLLWNVTVTNSTAAPLELTLANYVEFGILEFTREVWWVYLQRHFDLNWDAAAQCVRYNYHAYEAPYQPRILVGCSLPASGHECSRDAFLGRGGCFEKPASLARGFSNSELPIGGQACGVVGATLSLAPGAKQELAFVFTLADEWEESYRLQAKYRKPGAARKAVGLLRQHWEERFETLQAQTGDAHVDRMVNTWNAYQSLILNSLPCSISSEHMGIDGLRYRDTTQYALAPANLDPEAAKARLNMVFASQKKDGMGCYIFWPHSKKPVSDALRRSDNTVWQIYTVKNLVEETGDLSYLDQRVAWRDGGEAGVYEHVLQGLKYVHDNRGPEGLPLLHYADWNDCLVEYNSPVTETVMLAMQWVHSLKEMGVLARRLGRHGDAAWCDQVAAQQTTILNSDKVWDGEWYRRLLLGGGRYVGGRADREGKIWINPQTWSVISGVGEIQGRGRLAMEKVRQYLNSEAGLVKQHPAFGTDPEPGTEHKGSVPGVGENGGVFNHTNTWAIIAEAILGNGERAFEYYRRTIPAVVQERFGPDHYLREPYAYVSSVVGPCNKMFGQGGISWITGTSSWMYIAATQYVLGIKPTLDGLSVKPCLPGSMKSIRVQRRFRGCLYDIVIDNAARGSARLEVAGKAIHGCVVPVQKSSGCSVRCVC